VAEKRKLEKKTIKRHYFGKRPAIQIQKLLKATERAIDSSDVTSRVPPSQIAAVKGGIADICLYASSYSPKSTK